MLIRAATSADLAAITEIYNQAIATGTENAEAHPLTVADRQAWFDAHDRSDRYGVWVVIDHGHVMGYGSLSFYGFNDYYTSAAEVSYYLAQGAQEQGWGSQLLAFLVDWGQKMGITYLIGRALSNNLASNKLLLKYGFIKWGQSPDLVRLPKLTTSISYYAKYLK